MKKMVFNLQRFQDYTNSSPNKTLNGTSGDDWFNNSGSTVKIFAKGGNDTVKNSGNVVTISGGAGDDSIRNDGGSNITLSGDAGNDTIYSYNYKNADNTETISISGGAGDDSIYSHHGSKITLQGGNGNDTVESDYGESVKLYGGAGKNYLRTYENDDITIVGGADNDTIVSSYNDDASITAGAGNDSIRNIYGEEVIISAGDGNDYIYSIGDGVTIEGDKGNDTIELDSDYSQDTLLKYAYGDGDDTIFGFNSDDTLQITTDKKFTTVSSGNDLYITFDKGSIVLKNVDLGVGGVGKKNIVTIKGGTSDTSTDKLPTGLSLKGTTMTASNKFKGSAIDLTKYSTVKTLNASAVTQALKITGNSLENKISGGKGKDTIYGGASADSILGNAGNDNIFGEAGNDTLRGGAGNDTMTGGKGKDVFVHSSGKDVITDYNAGDDKIFLQDTTIKSWKVSGKNVIFTTTGGSITVENGKGKKISVASEMTYSKSSNAKTSDLFAENNFVTADNLSSIVKNDATPTDYKIEIYDFENLAQENNLITYSEK